MRVRILTSVDGQPCGAVVEMADDVARAQIASGDVEPADALETATADATETTMRDRARKKG